MIPRNYITAWRVQAPWIPDFQVEQDMVISRALVRGRLFNPIRKAQSTGISITPYPCPDFDIPANARILSLK